MSQPASRSLAPKLITARQAAQAAVQYLQDLTGAKSTFVEEAALDGRKTAWLITLSHDRPGISEAFKSMGNSRDYKQFKVSIKTGEVLEMSIRKL